MTGARFRELDEAECRALLASQHVGRLAFHDASRIDIEPISYVARGEWLFGRTQEGAKTSALRHSPYVAFEVDAVDGPYDWRSVVVHGTVYFLAPHGAPIEGREHQRAVDALREVLPSAFRADDPAPQRTVVFGLHVDEMVGRAAEEIRAPDARSAAPAVARPAPKKRPR